MMLSHLGGEKFLLFFCTNTLFSSFDRPVSPANVTTTYSTVAYMNDDGRKTPDKLKTTIPISQPLTPRGGYNSYEREESKTPVCLLTSMGTAGMVNISSARDEIALYAL